MTEQRTVLIVDDEDLVRDALELVMTRTGFSASSCASAQEALKCCEDREFDIILTDLVMPEMDGVAFIVELRSLNITTPVITLTGGARVGQQNLSQQAKEAGAALALRKPVNKQQIMDAIAQVLS